VKNFDRITSDSARVKDAACIRNMQLTLRHALEALATEIALLTRMQFWVVS
jgi:hypothetical protein